MYASANSYGAGIILLQSEALMNMILETYKYQSNSNWNSSSRFLNGFRNRLCNIRFKLSPIQLWFSYSILNRWEERKRKEAQNEKDHLLEAFPTQ